MNIKVEELKVLVEAGDESAIQAHIFASLEKGDVSAAVEANADVKSDVDSIKDMHHNTAFNTFKEKKLPGLIQAAVDEKVKELNPTETPEQKQIRELTEMFAKEKQKSARAEVRSKVIEAATSEAVGLDPVFVAKHIDKFIPRAFEVGEDGEIDTTSVLTSIQGELTGLAGDFKTVVSAQVESELKGAARTPGGGSPSTPPVESVGERLAKKNNNQTAVEGQKQFFGN